MSMTTHAKTSVEHAPGLLAIPDADRDRIRSMSDAELDAAFAEALGLTAKNLLRLAALWVEKQDRGHDLSGLRVGIAAYLPAIAAGTVLAESVVKFAGHPGLLRKVASLTPAEQKRI